MAGSVLSLEGRVRVRTLVATFSFPERDLALALYSHAGLSVSRGLCSRLGMHRLLRFGPPNRAHDVIFLISIDVFCVTVFELEVQVHSREVKFRCQHGVKLRICMMTV